MIGHVISHYRIVEKLGSGGMAVVFRARDEQLERDVAIKFLPPGVLADESARKRFRKEAVTLAKLRHPNIGTIYEFGSEEGRDYLVMECIPGTTLSERLAFGPLPEKEVLDVAAQVAAAIEEAHEHGIVHCDLKPSNVMITPKGHVKVLDFGVARLTQSAMEETAGTNSSIDDTGLMTGTLPYMAPEQLLGETTDARTDIHAFGVLLYEMIAARRAFPELLVPRVTESILHRTPLPPSALAPEISPELERIILKCLEKSPEDRYQSAKELRVDLRRLAAPSTATGPVHRPPRASRLPRSAKAGALILLAILLAALFEPRFRLWGQQMLGIATGPPIHSLAVLPVEDHSGSPAPRYFADGLTEAVSHDLAEVHRLRVIEAEPVMPYRGGRRSLAQIARELNVDALVLAAVGRSGNQVRITARLVRASDNAELWTNTYECQLQDIPRVDHEIVQAVARRASVLLSPEEQVRLADHPEVVPAAEDAYLLGLSCLQERTDASLEKARAAFERSIATDANYAPAYAGLAAAYAFCSCQGRPHPSLLAKAKEASLRALELDENLPEPHAVLGFVHMAYDFDWPAAQRELKRAVALNPSSADAHRLYGDYLVQSGLFQQGISEARRAVDLDPLSVPMNSSLAMALYYAHQEDAAVEQFKKTLKMDPNNGPALTGLGMASLQAGHYAEAAAIYQKTIALGYQLTLSTAYLAQTYALMGARDNARKTARNIAGLTGPNLPPAYALALIYTALGEQATAIDWLERAYEAREIDIGYLKVDPALEPLHRSPRFEALVQQVRIP
jgi:TolB-like protein/tetratricopeptide (TPR) repeat protein